MGGAGALRRPPAAGHVHRRRSTPRVLSGDAGALTLADDGDGTAQVTWLPADGEPRRRSGAGVGRRSAGRHVVADPGGRRLLVTVDGARRPVRRRPAGPVDDGTVGGVRDRAVEHPDLRPSRGAARRLTSFPIRTGGPMTTIDESTPVHLRGNGRPVSRGADASPI